MKKTTSVAACLPLVASVCNSAEVPPQTQIHNDVVKARIYLPDPANGFYRGTRFDWSGVIADLEYAGHNYYPQWFQRADPKVHDFIYAGPDIVAGPCTAVTGPAEEFRTRDAGLGFDEAKPGGTFIKIGVGVLRRPDAGKYDPYHLYEVVDPGRWTVESTTNEVVFQQELADPKSGFGYQYQKVVSLTPGAPQLVLSHRFRNTGSRPIESSVYNHNFLYLDRLPPAPEVSITLGFQARALNSLENQPLRIEGNRLRFTKRFQGEDQVYAALSGFTEKPSDYDIRIEDQRAGAGVRITADRPLARAALWAIRAPLSVEPFIDFSVAPGEEFTWRIQYRSLLASGFEAVK